ncbi:Uncharacterised protein [Yersinia enterocolitica subsp. palearctica]|nr:Uncharacterised protein [Yersinia enterocolitica subsp. palearctica]
MAISPDSFEVNVMLCSYSRSMTGKINMDDDFNMVKI